MVYFRSLTDRSRQKRLIAWPYQAILLSNSKQLEERRIKPLNIVMLSPAERRAKLEEGLVLERAGHWQEACDFWATCEVRSAEDVVFAMRLCGAALRVTAPQIAADALDAASAFDHDGRFAEKLRILEDRVIKIRLSQHRIKGVEAFQMEDFETAHFHLDALAQADPDHPWAQTKARIAAGARAQFRPPGTHQAT